MLHVRSWLSGDRHFGPCSKSAKPKNQRLPSVKNNGFLRKMGRS